MRLYLNLSFRVALRVRVGGVKSEERGETVLFREENET